MKKINIGLLGCGRVAQHYKNVLLGQDIRELVDVVAVCDVKKQRSLDMSESLGAQPIYNIDEFNKFKGHLDAVFILTPSGVHFEHSTMLLKRGFNVVCEKPLVMRPNEAAQLGEIIKKTGLYCDTVFQNRLNPAVAYLKSKVDDGTIGKIVTASVRLQWCRVQEYYEDGWHGTWKMDGGVINQQAIHHIDALRWIMGPVKRVCSSKTNRSNSLEAEDTLVAILEFENGALGTIEATTAARPRDFEASFSVVSNRGRASIGGIALNQLENWDFPGSGNVDILKENLSVEAPTGYGLSHTTVLKLVHENLTQGKPPNVTIDEAINTIELIHALYLSSEEDRWVEMTEKPQSNLLGL